MTDRPASPVLEQTYEVVAVDKLEPHPANPRRGDVPTITESVKVNGFYGAVVAQKSTGFVLAGNHRLLAAREAGATSIPCIWVDVDDAGARRILAVDNRSSDVAEYDEAALGELLNVLAHGEGGLGGTGFDADFLASLMAPTTPESLTDPDDAPGGKPKRAHVKPGEVWLLGPHRLLCGSATSYDDVCLVLDGAVPELLFTDPPYGVSYEGGGTDKLTIVNDSLAALELEQELLIPALTNAARVLKPGAPFYLCSPPGALETTFRSALGAAGLEMRQQIVWVKNQFVMGRSDYHYQHETLLYGWQLDGEPPIPPHFDTEHETMLYGWKDGAAHRFEGGRKQSTVWAYDRPRRSKEHPTMKPVQLVKRAIMNSTGSGGHVLDFFAGSGTTVIACHLTARIAHVIELDPRYCDVICRRYQEHTGITPVLERTGKTHDFTTGSLE